MHFRFPLLLLSLTAGLCSCTSTDDMDRIDANEAYTRNFIRDFGLVDKNQTWGFLPDTQPAKPYVRQTGQDAPRGKSTLARTTTPSSCDKEGNNWYQDIDYENIPKPVTDTERDSVVAAFRDPNWPALTPMAWSEFFVQQVFKGDTQYQIKTTPLSGGSSSISNLFYGSDEMDYITSHGLGDEHLKDFNHGNGGSAFNIDSAQNQVGHSDFIVRVKNSDTRTFTYGNAISKSFIDNDFQVKMVNGAYYIGFNFTLHPETGHDEGKEMELLGANNVYDDWIIKVTPAIYTTETPEGDTRGPRGGRLICEDLGTSGDWDFNDLVLDVTYTKYEWGKGWTEPVATVRAAGGELPIYVEGEEVHELLGVPTETLTNTGLRSVPVAIFRLENGDIYLTDDGKVDLNRLPIKVVQKDGSETLLQAYKGRPSAKILVPGNYKWCREFLDIRNIYPAFATWIGDADVDWHTLGAGQEGNVMDN